MENRITGKRPQPILDDEDEIITDNQQVMELNSAVDNLLAVTQGGLLQKALALSNEKCNNLVSRLNVQVLDLKLKVNDLTENNRKFVNSLKENVENVTRRLERMSANQTEIAERTTKGVQAATAKAIDAGIEYFSEKIDEKTAEVKSKLEEAEKELEQAKVDLKNERKYRKVLFWATPILLAVQTVISLFLLLS